MDTLMNVTLTYLNRLSISSFEAFPKALLTRSNPLMNIRNNPKLFIIILFYSVLKYRFILTTVL